MRVAHWPALSEGQGTIILAQGRGEFIELYGETIGDLRARGLAVIAFDFRGQGGSDKQARRGGHIGRFADYRDDLVAVVRYAGQIGLPRPFYVLGHSMGGLAALMAAPFLAEEVDRIVLTAPMLEVIGLPASPGLLSAASTAGSLVGLGRIPVQRETGNTPFANNRLTSDKARYDALIALADANPELMVGPPTLGWLRAALGAMRRVMATKGRPLAVPTLFIASGHDRVVSTVAIDRFARGTAGGGLVIIPGARHQVHLERDELRKLFFAAFDAFVTNAPPRLARARPARSRRVQRFTLGGEGAPNLPGAAAAPSSPLSPASEPRPADIAAVEAAAEIAAAEAESGQSGEAKLAEVVTLLAADPPQPAAERPKLAASDRLRAGLKRSRLHRRDRAPKPGAADPAIAEPDFAKTDLAKTGSDENAAPHAAPASQSASEKPGATGANEADTTPGAGRPIDITGHDRIAPPSRRGRLGSKLLPRRR
nr:alpha/beta fold hydrolase [Acuticoccus kalidii]